MGKKTVQVTAEELSKYDLDGSLGKLKEYIEGLIEKYGEEAVLDIWICGEYNFDIMVTREETDAEYEARLARESVHKEHIEKYERAQYEALKKKFENE